jgi:hypothetical protein
METLDKLVHNFWQVLYGGHKPLIRMNVLQFAHKTGSAAQARQRVFGGARDASLCT